MNVDSKSKQFWYTEEEEEEEEEEKNSLSSRAVNIIWK